MSIKAEWAKDCDMDQRDPNDLNGHLKVAFEEVIGEPENIRSIDCVWKYSYKCFNLWKTLCYIILTTICGIPMASIWGCTFAALAFCHIWECIPSLKIFEINVGIVKKGITILSDCVINPMCESCSLVFGAFKK